jgi:hypothetical protein
MMIKMAEAPQRVGLQKTKLPEDGVCANECWRKATFLDGVAWSRQNLAHRLQPYHYTAYL